MSARKVAYERWGCMSTPNRYAASTAPSGEGINLGTLSLVQTNFLSQTVPFLASLDTRCSANELWQMFPLQTNNTDGGFVRALAYKYAALETSNRD